jgi:hypothetical protein
MTDISIRPGGRALRSGWPVLLFLLAGCSSKGTVTGKITYQGKPLPVGTVVFVPEQGGQAITSDIRDGEYKIVKISPGPVKIAIDTPAPSGQSNQFIQQMMQKQASFGKSSEESNKPDQAPKPVPVPKKYHDPDTSGLRYTVKGGSQVYDIDLPDK